MESDFGSRCGETELENRLIASRPVPDERFVADLERRLLPVRAEARGHHHRPLLAATGAAAAMTAVALAFSLLQQGPTSPEGDGTAKAKGGCLGASDARSESDPSLVRRRKGGLGIRYRERASAARPEPCR